MPSEVFDAAASALMGVVGGLVALFARGSGWGVGVAMVLLCVSVAFGVHSVLEAALKHRR